MKFKKIATPGKGGVATTLFYEKNNPEQGQR